MNFGYACCLCLERGVFLLFFGLTGLLFKSINESDYAVRINFFLWFWWIYAEQKIKIYIVLSQSWIRIPCIPFFFLLSRKKSWLILPNCIWNTYFYLIFLFQIVFCTIFNAQRNDSHWYGWSGVGIQGNKTESRRNSILLFARIRDSCLHFLCIRANTKPM